MLFEFSQPLYLGYLKFILKFVRTIEMNKELKELNLKPAKVLFPPKDWYNMTDILLYYLNGTKLILLLFKEN